MQFVDNSEFSKNERFVNTTDKMVIRITSNT